MKIKSALFGVVMGCSFFANFCTATTNFWTKAALPWGYWHALGVSGDGNVLVAAGGGWAIRGEVYVSTNSGTSWTLTGAPNVIWTSVAASIDGHLLFAAAGGDVGRDHIYFSTNFGVDWTISSAPVTNWNSIACSSDGTKLVAAAAGPCSYGPIFLSTDAGATWTMADMPAMNWWSVASSADGSTLAAASVQNGIYLSTNSGVAWRRIILTNNWISVVTISANGQRLAASSSDGLLYLSADSGNTWALITNVPGRPSTIAASANGSELAVWSLMPLPYNQYVNGICISTDEGTTWTTNQWPYVDLGNATALLACSADGGTLAVSLGYDGVFTWEVPPPSAPVAVTRPAVGTNGDIVLHGMVNPNRSETWSWFDWDTSPAFANSTIPMFKGDAWGDIPFNSTLSGFPSGVAIYFRAAAANNLGFSLGRPVIYQEPLITIPGNNPTYVDYGEYYAEPGATVRALPISIAAGSSYCLALKADRTVVSWGNTEVGASGTFTTPPPVSNVVAIAAGNIHGLALKDDGTIIGWGDNLFGELNIPTSLNCAVAVSAGYGFSLALKPDGTVVGWGLRATNPAVYDGFNYGQAAVPEGLSNVVAIAAGFNSSLALKSDGTVVSWGFPLVVGTNPPVGLSNVVAIAAGTAYGLALKNDGTVVGWEYYNGTESIPPAGLSNVVAIAAGFYNNLALKNDGTVVGWGYPAGLNPPPGLSNVVAITAGGDFDLALKADGTVIGWGMDLHGETTAPTNLIVSLGAANVSGPFYGGPPGTYTVTYIATTTQGATGKATRTVIVLGTLDVRRQVLAEMVALRARQNRRIPLLDRAINILSRTVATNLWMNGLSAAEKNGQSIFSADMNVILMLNLSSGWNNHSVSEVVVQGWRDRLVKTDRLLAELEIARAYHLGISEQKLARAMARFYSGDRALATQQYPNSILSYQNAWEQAAELVKNLHIIQWPPRPPR